jgi:uroporphyrinogen-III synthase
MSKVIKVISSIAFEKHHLALLNDHNIELNFLKMMDIKFKSGDENIVDLNDINVPFVFTSQYAAQFVLDLAKENKFNTSGKKCFAIQGATSQLLHESNFEILGVANDSENLATIILEQDVHEVIHITSAWRLPTLEAKLKNRVEYRAVEVYDKIPIKSVADEYDVLVFSSPSHVESFLKFNEQLVDKPCLCIGKTTEKYLLSANYKNIHIAKDSSKSGLLEALLDYKSKLI